jgi:hypothetical protein
LILIQNRLLATRFCSLQIERQQFFKDLLIAQIGRPAVGGKDGGVQFFVGQVEPGGAGVVEVGEGALLTPTLPSF